MKRITLVGLGNIGSTTASLIARLPDVSRVTLIDPDVYGEENIHTQAIDVGAVGHAKVEVQAAVIRAIDRELDVRTIQDRIENVPVGLLRGSTLVACVDNRRARQSINRIARRCGTAWIDAAIGEPSLVRIAVYGSGASAPCLECTWDQASYDLLEQQYVCSPDEAAAPATGASAELGALAASLQVAELRKLMTGACPEPTLANAQLMLDTSTYTRHVSRYERNELCRFDHATWGDIETVDLDPAHDTLADLFAAAHAGRDAALSVEGHSFATYVDCLACDRRTSVGLFLYGRLGEDMRVCACGGRMLAPGFFSFEAIKRRELSRANSGRRLAACGLRVGDVLSVSDAPAGLTRHIEIGGSRADD
jgi:molybdopterin/thiamine biosynthesis adenylyltransferase